mmetsp:Transcript_31971/g.36490  ORF Transcript_31971/g.36490 Transcript_31971/m.36490 type:complete len:94 (+) Transcript_31971:256-537(+)
MNREYDRVLRKGQNRGHGDGQGKEKRLEIELEYKGIQRLNLELMSEFGYDEWGQQKNEDFIYGLEHQKQILEKKIVDINKKRKFAQLAASEEI